MRFSPVRRWLPRVILCVFGIGIGMVVGIGALQAARVTYQYDDAGRLKRVIYPDHATKDYALDPAGNRTNVQAAVPTGGVLAFEFDEYSVSEGVGTAQLSVTRSGNTTGTVTVNYATANGNAVAPGDYTTATGTLSWSAGDNTPRTINVAITNDTTPEATEQFVVNLSNASGGAVLGSITQATVLIVDNDNPTFSIANQSASESATSMSFTVSLSPASALTYQVTYATANGNATAGIDYTVTNGTLTFSNSQASQTITVPLTPDSVYEGNETFTVTLSAPTNGALLGAATATGTIIDDDAAPTFSIEDLNASGNENGGPIIFTVRMTGVSALTHHVNYATASGTAQEGVDFVAASGTLEFAPGFPNFRLVSVLPIDDTGYEGDEAFYVNLSNATNGATISDGQGVGTIIENDPAPPRGTLQFTSSMATVTEGQANATLTVSRINGSYGAASVTCSTSNGSASAGSDFTATSVTLSWADSETANKSCVIPMLEDAVYEGNETFAVTLSQVSGAALATPLIAQVTITDNDTPPLFSLSGPASVAEGGSATFTVTKSNNATALTHRVNYGTSNGSAVAWSDYTITSGTLEFLPNETTKTFTVPTIYDTTIEGTESFGALLTFPTNGATLGSPSSVTVAIVEPPVGLLQFASSAYATTENAGSVQIGVTRTGGSYGNVSVGYSTTSGTATAGSDYNSTSGTLSWADGDTATKYVSVTIFDDAPAVIFEADEIFGVSLSDVVGASIGSTSAAVVTIADVDAPPRFGAGSAGPVTEGGTLSFTLYKSGATELTHSVTYETVSGSATAGLDFYVASGVLTFLPHEIVKSFSVTTIDDSEIESTYEEFVVSFSNPTNGAMVQTTPATVGIIQDNESAIPSTPVASVIPGSNSSWFTLHWTASTGPLAYYELETSVNFGMPYTEVISSSTTSKQFFGGETDFQLRVRACNASNQCSTWSNMVHYATCPVFGCQ